MDWGISQGVHICTGHTGAAYAMVVVLCYQCTRLTEHTEEEVQR
jgi:hypothetical protein